MLDLAAESGCRGLLMGLESISPSNLQRSKKGFNEPENYVKLVEQLHARNIALQGCFVFGLDDDDDDVFLDTARFAVEARIDLPRFAVVTPFPGTALFRRLDSEGRILTRDWSLYDGQHMVFQPHKLSPREVEAGTEAAWKHAYSWRGIAQRLRSTGAPWWTAVSANLGYRFYAYNLRRFYTCDWALATAGGPIPKSDTKPAAAA